MEIFKTRDGYMVATHLKRPLASFSASGVVRHYERHAERVSKRVFKTPATMVAWCLRNIPNIEYREW
jgi:hypothetical protein